MELTRPGYAVIYVILLCALAQGGSEGKEEENYRDGGALSSPSSLHNHIHRKQVYQSFSISVFSSLEFFELFFFCLFMIVLRVLLSIPNGYLMEFSCHVYRIGGFCI